MTIITSPTFDFDGVSIGLVFVLRNEWVYRRRGIRESIMCNHYCNGKEKELERQLRQFRFPILK